MDSKKNKVAKNILAEGMLAKNITKEHDLDNKPHTHIHDDGSMHDDHIHEDRSVYNDHVHDDGSHHDDCVHEDGSAHHTHNTHHTHEHVHTNTRAVVNRLSRAIGHLEAVKKMVEDGRDCSEVLIQLAAVRSAINNTGKVILEDHIEHCIVDAIEDGDKEAIDKLNKAINQFVK